MGSPNRKAISSVITGSVALTGHILSDGQPGGDQGLKMQRVNRGDQFPGWKSRKPALDSQLCLQTICIAPRKPPVSLSLNFFTCELGWESLLSKLDLGLQEKTMSSTASYIVVYDTTLAPRQLHSGALQSRAGIKEGTKRGMGEETSAHRDFQRMALSKVPGQGATTG